MPNSNENPRENHRSLLIVQTAFLGDLLLGIPIYKYIRHIWPEHEIILVCRKGLGDFFLKTKLVDKVVEVVKGRNLSYASALNLLKNDSIEYVFSPHESLRTALFNYKIQAPFKTSFKKFWNSLFYDKRIVKNKDWPDPLRQLSLLFPWSTELKEKSEKLSAEKKFYLKDKNGKLESIPDWCSLNLAQQFQLDIFTYQRIENRLSLKQFAEKKWIMLFPGSVWATKMWTEHGFTEVGKYFQNKNYQVFIMGGPGEEDLGERIKQQIPGSVSLVGRTSIYESAILLARSSLMIGNDSASTHLACAADIPTVSIFGPTIIEFGFRPWSNQSYVVEKQGLLCRPCGPHGHRKCPLGTHECMKNIDAKNVIDVCETILQTL